METPVTFGIYIDGCKSADYDIVDSTYKEDTDTHFIRLKLKYKHHKSAPPLSLARAAVYMATNTGEPCPITLEPLSSYTEFYVGGCGHVFSEAAKDLRKCPMCRQKVAWAHVRTPL